MASYLITGCSRGLGLELTKQLVSASPDSVRLVIATGRSSSPSPALKQVLDSSEGRARYVKLEITNDSSIRAAFEQVEDIVGGAGLDVLVNNAGIQIFEGSASSMHSLDDTLSTNVIAVHKVTSVFLPLLSKGAAKKIVNISSKLGSMTEKDYSALAPFPSYKISKAALNMLTVQYAMELGPQGFTAFCLCPGWMQTDLGGPKADLRPEEGAKAVIDVIYGSTKEDNGAFRNIFLPDHELYNGKNVAW